MVRSSFWRRSVALLAVLTLTLFGGPLAPRPQAAQAAENRESPAEAAARLSGVMGGNVTVRFSEATGAARFVSAGEDATIPVTGGATAQDRAFAFFEQWGTLFGVSDARAELVVSRVDATDGATTVRMGQRHAGLPVFSGEMLVHLDAASNVTAANGTFVPGLKVPTTPAVSAAAAAGAATAAVAEALGLNVAALRASEPVLGIANTGLVQDEPGHQALAWAITVTGSATRQFVKIDALSGALLERHEGIHNELRRENYNMLEQSDYGLAVKCRFEGEAPSGDPDCDNAYTYSGDTYNFFYNGFRRDSFDNRGTALKSYVHYFSPICPNAFWNGSVMTYCSGFPHDDVAGHEITHGVTEFSANLVYAYQPGALNESFSDIFGEAIDLLNSSENEPGGEWLIGEGIAPGVGLRNMRDPAALPWRDPDACTSRNYTCSPSDNGGVHTNSGVPNKAFYLMVAGGTFNGVTVKGIGLAKAVAIQYRALTQYLSVYSNFTDANDALLASCRDLRNRWVNDPDPETGGARLVRVVKGDCAQVAAALDAVDMTAPVCTDVAPTAAGPLCASGETVARLFHDDHESGSPGWTASNDAALYTGQSWQVVTDFAASGTHAWRVDDELTSCSSGDWTSDVYLVSPEVNVSGTTRPVLRFLHDFSTEGSYDGGTVEVNLNGMWTKLQARDWVLNGYNGEFDASSTAPNNDPLNPETFTGYRSPGQFPALSYSESRVNLASYVAQDTDGVVQFRFRFGTDYCNGTDIGWYLDDVEVYDCKLG